MRFIPLGIDGAWRVESEVHLDFRGSFREWFKSEEVKKVTGMDFSVAQANVSTSGKGVIRGIHYSLAPQGQAKWVTCVSGRILDVIVDIRPSSETFKYVEYVELKSTDANAILIGPGLGHGFIALEENSIVSYLLNSPYSPENEYEIRPKDIDLAINWPSDLTQIKEFVLSEKDEGAPTLSARLSEGKLPN